jgi:hypothetical protein
MITETLCTYSMRNFRDHGILDNSKKRGAAAIQCAVAIRTTLTMTMIIAIAR